MILAPASMRATTSHTTTHQWLLRGRAPNAPSHHHVLEAMWLWHPRPCDRSPLPGIYSKPSTKTSQSLPHCHSSACHLCRSLSARGVAPVPTDPVPTSRPVSRRERSTPGTELSASMAKVMLKPGKRGRSWRAGRGSPSGRRGVGRESEGGS